MKKKNDKAKLNMICELASEVLGETIANGARLDAIVESELLGMDVVERMKFIATKMRAAVKEMEEMLPEEYKTYSSEYRLDVLKNLECALAYSKLQMDMYSARSRIYSYDELGNPFELKEEKNYWKEFSEIHYVFCYMQDIKMMMKLLLLMDFENPSHIMDELLRLVEAVLKKMAEFWKQWKQDAVEVADRITVSGAVRAMGFHYRVQDRMLQEVIALSYVTEFNGTTELWQMGRFANYFEMGKSYENYQTALYEMEYDCYLSKTTPVEEKIPYLCVKLHKHQMR